MRQSRRGQARLASERTGRIRHSGPRALLSATALATALSLGLGSAASGAAQAQSARTASPLPASAYSVRPVCAEQPGQVRCAALELVGESPAARAHSAPIGVTLSSFAAARVCSPPNAAEGCYGLRPQDLRSAYALPQTTPSAQNQTIAIVDPYNDPTLQRDLETYDAVFHLPPCTTKNGCLRKLNVEGKRRPLPPVNGEWAREISLDVEVAHAVCEDCHVLLVEAATATLAALEAAEERAAKDGATEISNSWDEVEPAADSAAFDHPGIVITAAAGDFGYLNWAVPVAAERGNPYYPASSPHVVAVGGTDLTLSASQEWSEETVWNGVGSESEFGASGGGCSASFEAPPWQRQLPDWRSVGCASQRASADVSADGDPDTGVAIYDTTPNPNGSVPHWITLGGTSLASPLIAAGFALDGGSHGASYPARTIYENAVRNRGSSHDVESGSNGECSKGVNAKGLSTCTEPEEGASCSEAAICVARRGYDGASGVGTPDGLAAFEPLAGRSPQTIAFTSTPPARAAVGGPPYAATATATSELEVALSSLTPAVCSLTGPSVSFTKRGTCTIVANQAGDSEYFEAASQVTQSFRVRRRR